MRKPKGQVVENVRAVLEQGAVTLIGAPEKEDAEWRPLEELLFDPEYYGERYPEAVLEVRLGKYPSLRTHYAERGAGVGFRPSAVFAPATYISDARTRFAETGGGDPILHYLAHGAAAQANPHWIFDESYYLETNPDVAVAVQSGSCLSGFHHFLCVGVREGRKPHPLFNPAIYPELNSVPRGADFIHYAKRGAFEDARVTGLFDSEWYAAVALDVVPHTGRGRTFDCLLQHFIQHGAREGRSPLPDFDDAYYVAAHEDVRKLIDEGTFRSAAEHWVLRGAARGFSPNRFFDAGYYLSANLDVAREIEKYRLTGAFEHFALFGRKQSLKCAPPVVQLFVDEEQAKIAYARRARTNALLSRSRGPLRSPSPESTAPIDVSIVIPVHNQSDYTYHLLQDLLTRKMDAVAEILVVDNASTDETRALSEHFPTVRILRNEVNLGFPHACNQGLRAAKGRIVVFANNDIEVTAGSVDVLVAELDQHPDVGAVGPRIVRMHGRLQEAGGAVYPDGSTAGHGRDDDPDAPRYGFVQDVHYCSAVFLAVRRELLERLGGFDERYAPGYYEEVDLCARVWESGHRVVVQPAAVVFHVEHASFATGGPRALSTALMQRHRSRFSDAQAGFLGTCEPRLASSERGSVGYAPNQPSILLIEDFLPLPFIGSGFPRANRIVRALTELGYRVVVYALFRHAAGTWLDARADLPSVEVHYDDESKAVLEELLTTREFSAVWLCRTHNLPRVLGRLSVAKSLKKRPVLVLDTEALASNRTATLRALNAGRESHAAEASEIRNELRGADIFDCVVAVNENERRQIASALPRTRVSLLSHEVPVRAKEEDPDFDARSDFLFVGSVHDELSPNHEGLSWFVRSVWPIIREREPTARLTIAGYWDPRVRRGSFLSAPGVTAVGRVDDLGDLYRRARVFVAPIRFAAGIPLKVQEAMSWGVPCAVTSLLAAQIGLRHGEDAVVSGALQEEEFARHALELYRSRALWNKVRSRSLARASADWAKERFVEGLEAALGPISARG